MMGECTKRELHSPQPSLLQLQLLWSSTSCKLQELSVLTTEAESLEQCFRCLYSEYVSFQTDRRAAESAVIVEAHTGIGIAAEQSALAVDVDALRREISFEKQELKGHTNVWRALRQALGFPRKNTEVNTATSYRQAGAHHGMRGVNSMYQG